MIVRLFFTSKTRTKMTPYFNTKFRITKKQCFKDPEFVLYDIMSGYTEDM